MEIIDDYTQSNKLAWEQTFDNRTDGWGDDNAETLNASDWAFFYPEFAEILKTYDLRGRRVAQICCNNGRETLSLVKNSGAAFGVGFDIAENMLAQARRNAEKAGLPCEFVACNALELPDKYAGAFDAVLMTIGATCWFEDLSALFKQAAKISRPGAVILIHEQHPFQNMLAQEGDPGYDPENPVNVVWSYFKKEPFVEGGGMGYINGDNAGDAIFTSFVHPLEDYIGGVIDNGYRVTLFREYEREISEIFPALSGKSLPLSFALTGTLE